MTETPLDKLNRLRWHCRRGMLELDVLLEPFVNQAFETLDADEQALFERLLSCEDADLFAWFIDRIPADDEGLGRMVEQVIAFARKRQ